MASDPDQKLAHEGAEGQDLASSSQLVHALQRVRDREGKSNVRSTDHRVSLAKTNDDHVGSAVVQEEADQSEGTSQVTPAEGSVDGQTAPSDGRQMVLTSWKTQEFAYRKTTKVGLGSDDELPTLARGLFTTEVAPEQHRIVVRGYDKFFNEDEMPWTKREAIHAYAAGPYELSFKENGCIIFIAALSPHQLIVTSKHSLGGNESATISHAQKGEEWLDRHLSAKGKSKEALAATLWQRNETAVAELCDDQFEEHVLAYPAERSGLHLHGLNANTVQFRTQSMAEVEQFASEWGFLPTRFLVMGRLDQVEQFCAKVAETGSFEGHAIEGFVVRTHMPTTKPPSTTSSVVAPPYLPGQAWFYKVKFDEPYLMYRDWRELTRSMLRDKQRYDDASVKVQPAPPAPPKTRSGKRETRLYAQWAHEKLYGSNDGRIPADPTLFAGFTENKGIIGLRQRFLEYLASPEGKARLQGMDNGTKRPEQTKAASRDTASASQPSPDVSFDRLLLVPIAVPGCGKTALAVALGHLLPDLAHTQSDDVQSKKTGPTFLRNVCTALDSHGIVFADRNNHLFKHRNEILDNVRSWQARPLRPGQQRHRVRLVAVAWSLDALPLNVIHHECLQRIDGRGDNHQSLRASTDRQHERVLWQFLRTLEPFRSAQPGGGGQGYGDAAFDLTIRLPVRATIEQNLRKVLHALVPLLSIEPPSEARIAEATQAALHYRVGLRKDVKGAPLPPIRYYALAIGTDLTATVEAILTPHPLAREALQRLKDGGRIVTTPHVTLVHNSDLVAQQPEFAFPGQPSQQPAQPDPAQQHAQTRWDTYTAAAAAAGTGPPSSLAYTLTVDRIAWDRWAMALGVAQVTGGILGDLRALQGTNWHPHITLGTFQEDIRPYEGNRVVQAADTAMAAHKPSPILDADQELRWIVFDTPLQIPAQIRGMS